MHYFLKVTFHNTACHFFVIICEISNFWVKVVPSSIVFQLGKVNILGWAVVKLVWPVKIAFI